EMLGDTEGLLLLVADRISQLETVADMSAVAMDLMSDSGRKLVPMLAAGRAGIEAWMREAREVGLVLDDRLILGFDALGGAVDRTGQRFTRAGQQFLSHFLAPAFVVNSWLNNAITHWNNLDEEQRKNIARWVAITAAILGTVGILGVLAG